MKYCIECGNQLVDEAKFCNKCGAKQPIREKVEEKIEEDTKPEVSELKIEEVKEDTKPESTPLKTEEVKEDNIPPVIVPEPVIVETKKDTTIEKEIANEPLNMADEKYKSMSPSERYSYLMKNDEAFKTIVKASRKKDLMSLSNLLFIIISFVCALMPYLVFTGVNVHHVGAEMMAAEGKNFPIYFGGLELFGYHTSTGNYALSPSDSLSGIFPFMIFLFGFLFEALFVLIAVLGSTRGYKLKQYEKGGAKELIKSIGGARNFMGVLVGLFPVLGMITTYIVASDLKYESGKTYIYGEIATYPEGLITAIIISAIIMVIMLVVGIIATVMYKKKINKYMQ